MASRRVFSHRAAIESEKLLRTLPACGSDCSLSTSMKMNSSIPRLKFAILLFLGSLCYLAIINSGHYGWSDDKYTLEAMHNWVRTGTPSVSLGNTFVGRDNRPYSRAEVGIGLVGMPGFLTGMALDRLIPMAPRLAPMLMNWEHVTAVFSMAVVTAFLVVVTGLIALELRVQPAWAALIALGVVFGCPTLEISRYLISTNPGVLGLACALLAIARARRSQFARRMVSVRTSLCMAFALCLTMTCRPTGFLAVPVLFAGWLLTVRRSRQTWLLPLVGALLGLWLKLGYNYLRSGHWLTTGYDDQNAVYFQRSMPESFLVSIIVPRWSILINCPLTLLGVMSAISWCLSLWKRRRWRYLDLSVLLLICIVVPLWCLLSVYVVPEVYTMRYLAEIAYVLALAGSIWAYHRCAGNAWGATVLGPVAFLLGIMGVATHLGLSLLSMYRFDSNYLTRIPLQGLANGLRFYLTVPPEAWEFYRQFARFPRPDWLAVTLFPNSWVAAVSVLYVVGTICVYGAMRHKRARLLLFAALLPPLILFVTSNLRRPIVSTVVQNVPAQPGRVGLKKVCLYSFGDEIVADYLAEMPGKADAKGHVTSFDSWLVATTNAYGVPLNRAAAIGGCVLSNTYMYDVPWEKMPQGSTVWFPGPLTSSFPGLALTPDLQYAFKLFLSYQGEAPLKIPLFEGKPPDTPRYLEARIAAHKLRLPTSQFLSDRNSDRGESGPVLETNGNQMLGVVIPNVRSIRANRIQFRLDFHLRGATAQTSIRFVNSGKGFVKNGLHNGLNSVHVDLPVTPDMSPVVIVMMNDAEPEFLLVPVYCSVEFQS